MKTFRVLIVDDVLFMRQFLTNCLKMTSPQFSVEEAGNGELAIERIKNGSFDLILCDWELPDVKGDDILRWLRTESNSRDIPFIMITGNSGKEFIVKALQLGVSDYIVKPVNCDTLTRKVVDLLRKKDAPRATGDERN